jgi:hypothetical protein
MSFEDPPLILAYIFLGWCTGIATFLIGWVIADMTKSPELDYLRKRNIVLEGRDHRRKDEGKQTPAQKETSAKKTQTSLFLHDKDA